MVIMSVINVDSVSMNGEDQSKVKPKTIFTFEEAIQEAKIGKCQTILIILTGLCVMGAVVENINIGFILPYAKCDLKLTTTEQGILNSMSFLGIVFSSHFWGFLADTWGRQKVLRLAAAGSFIFSFISAFATNTISLIVLRFVAGIFLGGIQAGAFSYISEFHTHKKASIAAAMVSIFINGEWIILAVVAVFVIPMDWAFDIWIVEFKPWRLYLAINSFLNLWNAIVFSYLPESPKFLLAMNRKDEALEVLKKVYAFNTGKDKQSFPVKQIAHESLGSSLSNVKGIYSVFRLMWDQTKPIFVFPLWTHTWKLCYIIFVVFSIGHGTFMWFPDFLVQLQNNNDLPKTLCDVVGHRVTAESFIEGCNIDNKDNTSFLIIFALGVFFIVLSTSLSFGMEAIDPKTIVCCWLLISMIACILLNYITGFYPVVISFIIFLSCCLSANIVLAVAVNLYPTQYRAMAMSFVMCFGRIGGVGGSNIIGLLLEDNCVWIFYSFGVILISCAFVFMMIKTKVKSTEITEPK